MKTSMIFVDKSLLKVDKGNGSSFCPFISDAFEIKQVINQWVIFSVGLNDTASI